MQLLKKFTTLVGIVLLSISCNDSNKECSQSQSGEEYAKNEASPTIVHSANEFPNEWWQLHIENEDTMVHPYRHIVVTEDSIHYFDDMEDQIHRITNIRTEEENLHYEFMIDNHTYSFVCKMLNDSESAWSLPSYWYSGETALYTNDRSRYKTYNFGIDTIYHNIGIEKVEAKWWGTYEFREIQFIDKQDTYIDTSWRYAALTIDSSLYIFQYGGRYDDRVALYAFSENKNRIQFTQGFAENTPKDTFVELYFDGEDYFLKCFGANEEYFPPLARLNKKTSSKEEIIMLRKDFRVKYAKKYPQKNGEYYSGLFDYLEQLEGE